MSSQNRGISAIRTFAAYSGTVLAAAAAMVISDSSSVARNEPTKDHNAKLSVHFMARLASKPYLNDPTSSVNRHDQTRYPLQSKNIYNRTPSNEDHFVDVPISVSTKRPSGIPSRLRILTIDVPRFKDESFYDGICELPSEIFDSNQPIFKDGIARAKRMDQSSIRSYDTKLTGKELRASLRPIEQKSLAQRLYYCHAEKHRYQYTMKEHRRSPNAESTKLPARSPPEHETLIGVEILEASVMNLNPNNIRRTYTSKTAYKYDPGKYATNTNPNEEGIRETKDGEVPQHVIESGVSEEMGESHDEIPQSIVVDDSIEIEKVNDRYDRAAPWNQYAWLEEMHLRVNGLVPFSSPMQRSSFFSHYMSGRIFEQSIPSSISYLHWMFPWWSLFWGCNNRSLEGVDGEGENALYDIGGSSNHRYGFFLTPRSSLKQNKLNRASNKPHAVVADGAAMQRVPGSLRFLSKVCREANVPLYILNDPRSWGSNTHNTLEDALVDLRRTVSDNIIRDAMELREGNSFERGRIVGRWEKELEWQARDMGRKTREIWLDAKQRWTQERSEDWSHLDEDSLKKKLIERKVLQLSKNKEGEDDLSNRGDNMMSCSHCLFNICRNCLGQPMSPSSDDSTSVISHSRND